MIRFRMVWCIALLILARGFAHGQQDVPPAYVFHPHQEVRVRDVSPHAAASANATAILVAALETIFHEAEVCCGKNSALQDVVESADPLSLKDVDAKLRGKHLLNDGRPITVSTEYTAPASINPSQIISTLLSDRPLLIEWNSRLYVLYGAVFDEKLYYSGQRDYVVHKLLLFDVRFADPRKKVTFNRDTDDWEKVQGLLMLSTAIPR
jgi:hypothetical protein